MTKLLLFLVMFANNIRTLRTERKPYF